MSAKTFTFAESHVGEALIAEHVRHHNELAVGTANTDEYALNLVITEQHGYVLVELHNSSFNATSFALLLAYLEKASPNIGYPVLTRVPLPMVNKDFSVKDLQHMGFHQDSNGEWVRLF